MDTIIAQATPSGESAISVIRVSGPLCKQICKKTCGYNDVSPRFAKLANYVSVEGKPIDEVIVTFYGEGNSYTGQDCLEISCHGNPLLSEWIIKDLIKHGCRLAEPGEFTKLAFLNDNIDLSQAEAVAQIISAKNHTALEAAQRNLKGELSKILTNIQDEILDLQAGIEAYIDFPEMDIGEEDRNQYAKKINQIICELEKILKQSDTLDLFGNDLRVTLVGLPNAGKSSLFNELLGKERALVSTLKGTTRDYLEMSLKVDNNWITLIDTAGIHNSLDELELEGIKRTYKQIEKADIIILVVDVSTPYPIDEINKIISMCENKTIILVKNKIDLEENAENKNFRTEFEANVSCTTKSGIDNLKKLLIKSIDKIVGKEKEDILYIGERHKTLITSCLQEITEAKTKFQCGMGIEIISSDLTSARNNIDRMIGNKTNEDILDKLFGKFCIGK